MKRKLFLIFLAVAALIPFSSCGKKKKKNDDKQTETTVVVENAVVQYGEAIVSRISDNTSSTITLTYGELVDTTKFNVTLYYSDNTYKAFDYSKLEEAGVSFESNADITSKLNAGTYQVNVKAKEKTGSFNIVVNKANYTNVNNLTLDAVDYSIGLKLKDITLPNGYTWKENTEMILTPGNYEQSVIYNLDKANYNDFEIKCKFTLNKIIVPEVAVPILTPYEFYYDGKPLSNIELPTNFTWKNPLEVPTTTKNSYTALYNPDASLYLTREVEIVINVTKSTVQFTSTLDTIYTGKPFVPVYNSNASGNVTIYYKLNDPEAAYTTNVPVNAGNYKAKFVFEETDNNEAYECEVEFDILKQTISPCNFMLKDGSVPTLIYTGSPIQYENPDFPYDLYEIVGGELEATETGHHFIKVKLKNPENYAFVNYPSDHEFTAQYSIVRNSFSMIKINDVEMTFEEFMSLSSINYNDTLCISYSSGKLYYSNTHNAPSGEQYKVTTNSNIFTISYNETNNNFTKYLNVLQVGHFTYDNVTYDVTRNNQFIEAKGQIEGSTMYFDDAFLNNYSLYAYYSIHNSEEITDSEYVLNTGFNYIIATSKENKFAFNIYLNEFSPIKSLNCINVRLTSTNYNDETQNAVAITPFNYQYNCYTYSYLYEIALGYTIDLKDDYKDCKAMIIDENNNVIKAFDFNNNNYFVVVYDENDELIFKKEVYVSNSAFEQRITDSTYATKDLKNDYSNIYVLVNGLTYTISTYSEYHNVNIYIGDELRSKTYDNYGVYLEDVRYEFSILGRNYSKTEKVYVIVSKNASDYVSNVSIDGNSAYVSKNIYLENDYSTKAGKVMELRKEDVEISPRSGYSVESYNIVRTINDDNTILAYLEMSIKNNSTSVVTPIYFYIPVYDLYSTNNSLLNDEITIQSFSGNYKVKAENNVFNIKLNNFSGVSIDFNGYVKYSFLLNGEGVHNLSYITRDYLEIDRSGSYELTITASSGDMKTYILNVTYEVSYLIEANAEGLDKEVLFTGDIDDDPGNVKIIYNDDSTDIIGFVGKEALNKINDGKLNITVNPLFSNILFLDNEYNNVIENKQTVTLDVQYEEVFGVSYAYVILYMYDGYDEFNFKLYLADKIEYPAKVVIDSEEYDLLFEPYEYGMDFGDFEFYGYYGYPIFQLCVEKSFDSITLKTNKVFDDYSYSIITFDKDFDVNDFLNGEFTFESLEQNGYLYRVTNTNTLSVDISLINSYGICFNQFIIVAEGVEDVEQMFDEALYALVEVCYPSDTFRFTLDNYEYYDSYDAEANYECNILDFYEYDYYIFLGDDSQDLVEDGYITLTNVRTDNGTLFYDPVKEEYITNLDVVKLKVNSENIAELYVKNELSFGTDEFLRIVFILSNRPDDFNPYESTL